MMKLSRLHLKILLLLLTLSLNGTLLAAVSSNSYQGQVPVASHSPADWDKAVGPALQQVLINVSGNPAIVQDDAIKRALKRADNFVQSYNYVTAATPNALSLQVRFSSRAVNDLLQTTNQSVQAQAPQNRPLTLVWLAVQDTGGQPQILTDNKETTVANLQQQADQTGLPLLWPAGDLEDLSSVSASQVWQLDQGAVREASQRYQTDHILLGKIQKQTGGGWQGDWVLLGDRSNESWQTQGSSASQAATAVVAKLGAAFADNSVGGDAGNLQTLDGAVRQVSISVVGINGLNDYTALVNYLRSLSSVSDVSATQMGGDRIVLSVMLRTDQSALINEISRDTKLTLADAQNASSQTALAYRWTAVNTISPAPDSSSAALVTTDGGSTHVQSFPVTQAQIQYTPDTGSAVPEEVSP